MFPNLQAFLYELYEDFSRYNIKGREEIEKCFYYDYTKKQKGKQAAAIAQTREQLEAYAARAKPNKYVLLHAAYLAFKFNKITAEEYKEYYGRLAAGKRKAAEIMAADIKDASDVAGENDALEMQLLKNIVRDFFDNAGFKALKDDEYTESGNSSSTRSKYSRHSKSIENNTDNIDMLCAYLDYKNEELTGESHLNTAAITEEFKLECAETYKALSDDPSTDLYVPLYFDSRSGAGIFIIGKDQFDRDPCEEIEGNNVVCIVRFDFINEGAAADHGCGLELSMAVDICSDVSSAFEKFENEIRSDKCIYLEGYSDINMVEEETFNGEGVAARLKPLISPRSVIIKEQKKIENRQIMAKKQADKQGASKK